MRPGSSARARVTAVLVALAMPLVAVAAFAAPACGGPPGSSARTYRPPVTAPVADPFRPPPDRWSPGNRGLEYRTAPGSVVRAIGPGVVTFAGRVAGELDVTVRHPDGLRSSYVDLATAAVAVGTVVRGGEPLGRSTDRLHLGVRRGSSYLDPASLWGTPVGGGRVLLVPRHGRLGVPGGPSLHSNVGPPPGASTSATPGSIQRSLPAPLAAHRDRDLEETAGEGAFPCRNPS